MPKLKKTKKFLLEKAENSVQIFGLRLASTSYDNLLREVSHRLEKKQRTFIFTPNPEFIVAATQNPSFAKILNQADILLPDGVGLILASWFLGKPLKQRLAGADLVTGLLNLAQKNHWRVGVVEARRGVKKEEEKLIKRLQKKYPGAVISQNWQKAKIVFACQGMIKQEKWILENSGKTKTKGIIFLAAGGALDYLTGFIQRAPLFIRLIGLEWFWRLVQQPWRWRRQLSLFKFVWLVVKEKIT